MGRIDLWVPLGEDPDDLRARFEADPGRWLPPPALERGPDHWAVDIHAGPITRTATCAVAEPFGDDEYLRRRVGWQADPEPGEGEATRALPSLDGTLTLRTIADSRCDLGLAGTYQAPTGPIGASFGPAQLQALAEAAAAHFLHRTAAHLLDPAAAPEPPDAAAGGEETPATSS
jgi:hypothetical protein